MPKNKKKQSFFSTLITRFKTIGKKHPVMTGASIALVVLLGLAGICWKFEYHGESPQLIAVQHQENKNQRQATREFNRNKQDSFPTVQQAHDYLKSKFGVEPDSSQVSAKQINNALVQKYGKTAANLLQNGYCLSEVMTPAQEAQQEVLLARNDPNQADYVGFNQVQYTTSIYHPNKVSGPSHVRYNLDTLAGIPENKTMTYTNLKHGYQVSDPVLLPYSMKQLTESEQKAKKGNGGTLTMLLFIKVPNKTVYRFEFNHVIDSLNVQVDGQKAQLAQGAGYSNGLQLTGLSNSANKFNLKKSYKIFRNSLVPVAFEVHPNVNKPIAQLNVKVNGNNLTHMMLSNNAQINF